eukprot:3396-Pyramimonas_sp.AAC.1
MEPLQTHVKQLSGTVLQSIVLAHQTLTQMLDDLENDQVDVLTGQAPDELRLDAAAKKATLRDIAERKMTVVRELIRIGEMSVHSLYGPGGGLRGNE